MKRIMLTGILTLASVSASAMEFNCKVKDSIFSNIDGSFSKATKNIVFKYNGDLKAELNQKLINGVDGEMSLRGISRTQSIQAGGKYKEYKDYEKYTVTFQNVDASAGKEIRIQLDENRDFRMFVDDSQTGKSLYAYKGTCSTKLSEATVREMSAELEAKNEAYYKQVLK